VEQILQPFPAYIAMDKVRFNTFPAFRALSVTYFRKQTSEEAIISQWWEAEAQVELSFYMELKDIGLICNFVHFQDPKVPCQLLASRKNSPLKNILVSLDDTRKVKNERKQGETYQSNLEIRSLWLAEEVMRFLAAKYASSAPESAWRWEWEAPDHRTISQAISFQISSVFYTIIFSDWIRIALGYQVDSFPKLINWVITTRNICRQCLNEKPHLRLHYERHVSEALFLRYKILKLTVIT
jgi:hypothetical protein